MCKEFRCCVCSALERSLADYLVTWCTDTRAQTVSEASASVVILKHLTDEEQNGIFTQY